jgi:type IV pilus assembly protein PilN
LLRERWAINLLLARKEKKKIGLRKEFVIAGISIVIVFICLAILHWRLGQEREDMIGQITKTRNEITYYKSLMVEVNKAKEAQKAVQEKLNVITSLRKEKASPARVLDAISALKPEKLQLESLRKEGSKLGIEGIALDDETVANFMTELRKSKLFRSVDLIVSEQSELSKVKLKKFTLSCEIAPM